MSFVVCPPEAGIWRVDTEIDFWEERRRIIGKTPDEPDFSAGYRKRFPASALFAERHHEASWNSLADVLAWQAAREGEATKAAVVVAVAKAEAAIATMAAAPPSKPAASKPAAAPRPSYCIRTFQQALSSLTARDQQHWRCAAPPALPPAA